MDKNQMATTLKAVALIGLVENGIIQRDENGDINTDAFERFWARFERNVDLSIQGILLEMLQEKREERAKNGT